MLAVVERWDEAIAEATAVIERTHEPELRLLRAEWNLNAGHPERMLADIEAAFASNELLKRRCNAMKVLAYRALGDKVNEAQALTAFQEDLPDEQWLNEAVFPMVAEDISLRHPRLAAFITSNFDEFYYVLARWPGSICATANTLAPSTSRRSTWKTYTRKLIPMHFACQQSATHDLAMLN